MQRCAAATTRATASRRRRDGQEGADSRAARQPGGFPDTNGRLKREKSGHPMLVWVGLEVRVRAIVAAVMLMTWGCGSAVDGPAESMGAPPPVGAPPVSSGFTPEQTEFLRWTFREAVEDLPTRGDLQVLEQRLELKIERESNNLIRWFVGTALAGVGVLAANLLRSCGHGREIGPVVDVSGGRLPADVDAVQGELRAVRGRGLGDHGRGEAERCRCSTAPATAVAMMSAAAAALARSRGFRRTCCRRCWTGCRNGPPFDSQSAGANRA